MFRELLILRGYFAYLPLFFTFFIVFCVRQSKMNMSVPSCVILLYYCRPLYSRGYNMFDSSFSSTKHGIANASFCILIKFYVVLNFDINIIFFHSMLSVNKFLFQLLLQD